MNKQVDTELRHPARDFMPSRGMAVGAVVLVLFLFASLLADKPLPRPTGYLSDFAGVVDGPSAQHIESICRELDQKTGAQIGVASFKDMGGDDIDNFTNRLFDQWMPGQRGVDNGILIVNAVSERKVRIEIGYGLESVIPDAVTGRIRREIMNPLLQQGKYGEAYLGGVAAIASLVAQDKHITLASLSGVQVPQTQGNAHEREGRRSPLYVLFPIGFFVLVALLNRRNRYRGGGPWIGGPFIGGGFGGGGGWGGGGGFGGFGGGMSGGGGSSGGY